MAIPHVPRKYTLLTLNAARRRLDGLAKSHNPAVKPIVEAILSLSENPRPPSHRKLANRSEVRIRVGNYRVLYLIDDENLTVTITAIGHRREVYRRS
jgi:mRNA interferase RelE/StbE